MSEAVAFELEEDEAPVFPPGEVDLSTLRAGERAVVVRLDDSDSARLHKLLALGILPGVSISVRRRSPCYVIEVGYSQLALDSDGAASVFVRRMVASR